MFRINLFWTDGYLLLTPQLGGLPRYAQIFVLLLGFALLLFLVYRLYRYELQFLAKKYSLLVLALRLSLAAIVFWIVALKPTARRVSQEEIPAQVLIAIDRSDSMSITDPQRDPLEKLELARALKLAAGLADDKTLDGWMDRLRRLEPPADEAYRKVLARVDAMPRKAFAERVLDAQGIGLLDALGERHKVEIVGFSQQLARMPLNLDSIRSSLQSDGKSKGDSYTDLKLPLKHGLSMREEVKDGLIGIVVFSDGQHNWGKPPGDLAYQLGHTENRPSVPVYPVVCGARLPPPDLAIVSVKATPPIVFKHGIANVEVRMTINNLPPGKVKVTVAYPEAPDSPHRQPIVEFVDFDGVNQPPPRIIPVKMDRAALEKLTVTAELQPNDGSKAQDRFPENNTRQVVVNVAPDKAKVLVIDGETRWESHYLQTALRRDETMETKTVIFGQPRLNLVKIDDAKELSLPERQLPGLDELPRNDCIILADVSPDDLPFDDRVRLEKFVADRGGTLVILAGKQSMPLEFLKPGDPIGRMLPIADPKVLERKQGFHLALSSEGLQTGFLRLENEAAASEDWWAALPPHYWAVVGSPKPGAAVLAYVPDVEKVPLVEPEKTAALIVRQNYGFGRVVYVGIDSTWRWRFKQGDKYHHRFWSQVIRWAASDRALTTGNDFVRFGVREPVYRSDQEVELLVRLSERVKKTDKDTLAGARLLRKTSPGGPEEMAAMTPLRLNPEVPGQLEGTQSNLPPGDYAMELVSRELEDKLLGADGKNLRATFKVLPPETGEMLNLAANWDQMKEIADKSGGTMFSADQAGELLEKLKMRTAYREVTTDTDLRRSWWLLIVLVGLLTSEWLLRKWVGLV